MINLIILGSPGAGKGTQAEIIARKYDLYHLSSSKILKQKVKNTNLKEKIDFYLNTGKLVPNNLIIKLINVQVEKYLGKKGIIFDGYPRSLLQAKSLDNLFAKKNIKPALVINLDLKEKTAISRIMSRGQNSNRSDDKLDIVTERFKVYYRSTKPLLNYYKKEKRLINIDGQPDIETVNQNIQIALNH
jgi:adenylate kinase